MSCKIIISKAFLTGMLKDLARDCMVIAPVRNGRVLEFMNISSIDGKYSKESKESKESNESKDRKDSKDSNESKYSNESEDTLNVEMNDEIPYNSPKGCLFPQVEKLLTFRNGGVDENIDVEKTVIFGAKPCDTEALRILNAVFTTGRFQDPFFKRRLDECLIVAVGCVNKKPGCFCTERGIDMTYSDFCDIMLNYADDDCYSVRYLSEKGKELLQGYDETRHIAEAEHCKDVNEKQYHEDKAEVEPLESILMEPCQEAGKKVELDVTKHITEMDLFEVIDWGKASEICRGCGMCSFICPTCHCFDQRDVPEEDRKSVV